MPVTKIVSSPHFSFITPEKLIRSVPSLATWGAAAGVALALFGSDVPLVKQDVLSKIPVAGSYWAVPAAADEE
ncbi:hypothetical protein EC973_001689 [Apophysomyces ossiformis]|uniref:Cytochrome b-c1 complex subunit 10 n=1 Tax=Apophysomyces ossiformis TaxID=679940 RepID=A0A8H7BPP9_9FUNG|nr:hypothetical protein EC973_001689 [Apophysomyces ossiformis]